MASRGTMRHHQAIHLNELVDPIHGAQEEVVQLAEWRDKLCSVASIV